MPAPKKNKPIVEKPIEVSKTKRRSTPKTEKLTNTEQKDLKELFNQALNRYKAEMQTEKKIKLKEISHLALIAEEYLSSFALIGYSLQNEKVVIFNTPTAKDEAALVDLLRATFVEIVSNRP